MSNSRIGDDPSGLSSLLCVVKNRIDMISVVELSGAVALLHLSAHGQNTKVRLDAAQESCCSARRLRHLVIHAICLRTICMRDALRFALFKWKLFPSHLRQADIWKSLEGQNFLLAAHVHSCCHLGGDRHAICHQDYQVFGDILIHFLLQTFLEDGLPRMEPELSSVFFGI